VPAGFLLPTRGDRLAITWARTVQLSRDVDPALLLCSAIAGQASADERAHGICETCGEQLRTCAGRFLERLRALGPADALAIATDMFRTTA
jgi:predicted amidophosphoribosyltransferase